MDLVLNLMVYMVYAGNSSEFGSGVVDHGMETIDLSDDVKYDGIDLVLNPKFVVPSTHRKRNFGYYKVLYP